jgi:two-component system, NarL family, response regulator YdfI
VRIALLSAGSQERLWFQNLLAQTPYQREVFELAALDFAGQPTYLNHPYDLYLLSEGAAPPHLLSRLLRELPASSAVLVIATEAGVYRALLAQGGRRGWGILPPSCEPQQLQAAIAAVLQGLCVFPPVVAEDRLLEPLTPREQEIAILLAQGLTNKQIARHLHLSENTIKTHITAIFGKTGVNNRTELAALAIRLGWIAL